MSRPPRGLAADDAEIGRIVALAREHLGMDVVYVAEFTDGKQVFRGLEGDPEPFGITLDAGPVLSSTYCRRMVHGLIPSVIPDTTAEPRVRDLPITASAGIGAYVGVPLRLTDGRVYGTFCCLSSDADHTLDERDGKFMGLLAQMLVERLESHEAGRRQRAIVTEILAAGALDVALQPIVRLADGHWRGCEALARYATAGLAPDAVFAMAHEAGLGTELELLSLGRALELMPAVPDESYLSVNMSPTGLLAPELPDLLSGTPDLHRIVVEVTEHASIPEYAALVSALAPLRAEGLRLAVDDVGAGYASFRHVLQLEPDIIKIDRFLIDGLAADAARRSIVASVISLAADLGATIVAEGVEETTDLAALVHLGADMAQGYLLARPSTDPATWRQWQRGLAGGEARRS